MIPSRIAHRPLTTYQISLKLRKTLHGWIDKRMNEPTLQSQSKLATVTKTTTTEPSSAFFSE